MSKGNAARAKPPTTGEVFNFVELSCFTSDEELRYTRAAVAFRLFSVGKGLGQKLDVTFTSDYGIYYGAVDDEYLLHALESAAPTVDWRSGKVYHRWLDQSRIQILCEETGKLLAQVETRRYMGRKVKAADIEAGAYGPDVITLDQIRTARIKRLAEKLAADRELNS